jgi:hypothetical protein
MNISQLVRPALLAGIALFAGPASASSITILNSSFELDTALPNSIGAADRWISGSIIDWSVTGDTGAWHPSSFEYPGGGNTNIPAGNVPDGVNVAYSNGGLIAQTLGTALTNNTAYTLGVYVGHRADGYWNHYTIELLAGGNVIASATDPVDPGAGNFGLATVSYAAGTADPNAGGLLGIEFLIDGVQVNFDDVTLEATSRGQAVPEPASLALLGIGLAGLGLARRRKAA